MVVILENALVPYPCKPCAREDRCRPCRFFQFSLFGFGFLSIDPQLGYISNRSENLLNCCREGNDLLLHNPIWMMSSLPFFSCMPSYFGLAEKLATRKEAWGKTTRAT